MEMQTMQFQVSLISYKEMNFQLSEIMNYLMHLCLAVAHMNRICCIMAYFTFTVPFIETSLSSVLDVIEPSANTQYEDI